MKYSLFRFIDFVEITILYFICFIANILIIFVQTLNLEAYPVLKSFVESILDLKLLFIFFLTLIVLVFHYQFLDRKKTEVYCRILVGETRLKLTTRYILNNLAILFFVFILSVLVSLCLDINLSYSFYLFFLFILYIIFFAGWVNKK